MKREKIGIVASKLCGAPSTDPKRWFHIQKFVSAYKELLDNYEIIATESTATLLGNDLKITVVPCSSLPGDIRGPAERDFQGTVRIASMVAKRDIHRVLMFQDPSDTGIERPENYALLRNCNLSGGKLYINATAHLWALHQCEKLGIPQKWRYEKHPRTISDTLKETVAFIAHDREKSRIARFALHFREVLKRFPRLIATSGTKKAIDVSQVEHLPPWERLRVEAIGTSTGAPPGAPPDSIAHGPSGGDVIIADEVFTTYTGEARNYRYYSFYTILFFVDHRSSHPHEPDIQVLLKTCANPHNQVNLILNSRMAEEWASRYRES